ncbi:hypothetical protein F5888DRAFT_1631600 [Russula emetica]|nr:hypothetical protein F5888DRAFT_1631600 [Russula emetica]
MFSSRNLPELHRVPSLIADKKLPICYAPDCFRTPKRYHQRGVLLDKDDEFKRGFSVSDTSSQSGQSASARSSFPPNTVLVGMNYFKDQPSVLALPDEGYPSWLWKLLDKFELPDDGPGGKANKHRLRKENIIGTKIFMKTQSMRCWTKQQEPRPLVPSWYQYDNIRISIP